MSSPRKKNRYARSSVWYLNFGNTNVSAWDGKKSMFSFRSARFRPDAFFKRAKVCEEVWISSVVPKLSARFIRECRNRGLSVKNIRAEDVPIQPAYSGTLGIDRLLNVFAAAELLKRTKRSAKGMVIDFGTALTLDVFQLHRHLGGWILPGLYLMSDSLFKNTSLLPKIELNAKDFQLRFGKSTRESLAGGQVNMLKGLVEQAAKLLNEKSNRIKIYLTGGKSQNVNMRGSKIPFLSLKGLQMLREMSGKKN